MSVRLATKVTGPTSGGPPLLGSAVAVAVGLAVAVAVGLAVAVAVAVGLAVMPPPPCCLANAAEESSSTSTALTVNRTKILFMKHLLYELGALFLRATTFPFSDIVVTSYDLSQPALSIALFTQVPRRGLLGSLHPGSCIAPAA
jgi:hypothetical protein